MNVNEIKLTIYKYILQGNISDDVFKALLSNDGTLLAKEWELWDYKKTFEGGSDAYLKLLKHIMSYHNTYGGYIFYGIDEIIKDSEFIPIGVESKIIDQQKLRGMFDKYCGRRLDLTYFEKLININGSEFNIGILYIPKRTEPRTISSTVDKGEFFKKDAVYFRIGDECKQVVAQGDYEFVSGERDFFQKNTCDISYKKKFIEHNLPDKNYICPKFIGRSEVIQELWAWLSDDFQYSKVLAADGGKGKTSIAYEFCQLIIKSGIEYIDQVIWLTAKKKQFKALSNAYINSPETHYEDSESLLREICLRTGALPDEIKDYSLRQLKRTAQENLKHLPSFIVVDDVDSNTPDEQRKILEYARQIANRDSRVLLTTRINTTYSSDSSIEVPGLNGQDYIDLIGELCNKLKLPNYSSENIENIRVASGGSPLFTESILRLCKSVSVNKVVSEWKNKSGDAVREAALRKEISELTHEAIKILIVLSSFDTQSKSELHLVTDMEVSTIDKALQELESLFLLQAQAFIETDPRFKTSQSIASVVLSVSNEILPNAKAFIKKIDQYKEGINSSLLGNVAEVGEAINASKALINQGRFDEAERTIDVLIKKSKYKNNADLYFALARAVYHNPNNSSITKRKLFADAYIKGQRKPQFFDMWYSCESKYGTKDSIHDVCLHVKSERSIYDISWMIKYAYSNFHKSLNIFGFRQRLELLVESYEVTSVLIKKVTGVNLQQMKELSIYITDEIWNISFKEEEYLTSAKAMINALNDRDLRTINCERLIEASKKLRMKKSNKNHIQDELFECFGFLINELGSQPKVRDGLVRSLKEELNIYSMQPAV